MSIRTAELRGRAERVQGLLDLGNCAVNDPPLRCTWSRKCMRVSRGGVMRPAGHRDHLQTRSQHSSGEVPRVNVLIDVMEFIPKCHPRVSRFDETPSRCRQSAP